MPAQSAAFAHEAKDALANVLCVEDRADGVIQIERVVSAEPLPAEIGKIVVEDGFEGTGLPCHRLNRDVGIRERAMSAVRGLHVDDQQLPRLLGARLGGGRYRRLDLLLL